MLIAIWAQAENGLIGNQGKLPWRLPADLQYFREQTIGHTLVMGRKTFEGMGGRPLPGRKTVILTRDHDYQVKHENVQVLHSKAEVLQLAKDSEQPVYIAGGAEVYQLFEPYYDRLLKTVITGDFAGDAYFPKIDCSPYELVSSIAGVQDEKNQYPFHFETWQRKP